ncbi:MAG: enoyl-CoA hydratase-related protein [Caulobacteraceae bacterium]
MADDAVLYEKRGQVALVTLNVPERLNAIGQALREGVHRSIDEARADDAVRAVIITGNGRGFCSGADLTGGRPPAEAAARPPPRPSGMNDKLDEMHWVGRWAMAVSGIDKPVIGAINGVAAGAGMSLALACDMRVGSENARFKTVFIERNLSPDSGMSYFLPRIVGYSRAADLIFSSRNVEAEEAYRIGLLDRLVKHENLVEEAMKVAESMASQPPMALRVSKRVLQRNQDAELFEALRYEAVSLDVARKATNDAKESRMAFLEKRKGVFTGT